MNTFNYTPPGGIFWSSKDGRVQIIKHCDIVYELLCDGIQVMPTARFEKITYYIWSEFPPF